MAIEKLKMYKASGGEILREKIHRGISLLSTSYKILTNILASRLTPYIDEIIEDHIIGMCLNGTKNIFEIHNGLKQGDALSPLLFNFILQYALEDKQGVQLSGIHKLLVYADDIVLLGHSEKILKDNMHIVRSNTRKLGLEQNINTIKYMVTHKKASYNAIGQLMTDEPTVLGDYGSVCSFLPSHVTFNYSIGNSYSR
ncbi:hypothetical protein C0J52_25700 [Blattella germanica]|nr:hypothetical protein C0J52_25700 [Blattella germanica]